jgi:hypothetical protein
MIMQIWLEYIQATGSGKLELEKYAESDIWNFLDIIRIVLMLLSVVITILYMLKKKNDNDDDFDLERFERASKLNDNRSEIFSLLVLFSFLGLLQYFRLLR